MSWLFDEDINRPTVAKFLKAGIKGKHIQYDLAKGGKEDPDVVEIARKENRTIITADPTQYLLLPKSTFHNTGGVWIVRTDNQDSQVKYVKEAIEITGMKSFRSRKEKQVDILPTQIKVYDCRSNKDPIIYARKKARRK